MTPDELRSLADEAGKATPTPWREKSYWHFYDHSAKRLWASEVDTRLIALAPDLARLCAELGEAATEYRQDRKPWWRVLTPQERETVKNDSAAYRLDAALSKLAELETPTHHPPEGA